jgi:hypothetical protein
LVAIAVPVFNNAKASAVTRACQANLRTIDGAVQAWRAEHISQNYPANGSIISGMVTDGYLKSAPTCPGDGGTYLEGNGGGQSTPNIACPNGPNTSTPAGDNSMPTHVYP